jgi:hypothetical protein
MARFMIPIMLVTFCSLFVGTVPGYAGAKEDCRIEIADADRPNGPFAYVKNMNQEKKILVTVAGRGSTGLNPPDQVIRLAPGQRVLVGPTKAANYGNITYSIAGATYE